MINQAAEFIHGKEKNDKKEKNKIEKTQSVDSVNGKKKKPKSPSIARRLLPSVPKSKSIDKTHSRSTEDLPTEKDDKSETLMAKYKYNSLPRKKKDNKNSKQITSSSTFYVSEITDALNEKSTALSKANSSPKSKKKDVQRSDSTASSNSTNFGGNFEQQTHIALYKFYPRHKDELTFLDGDPIQVTKMFDDLWYEGVNLLTGKQGVFPCRYVADIMAREEISSSAKEDFDHRQFHLRFLGSVEVSDYKGDEVLCFAIAKVVNQRSLLSSSTPPICALQVNSRGIRICNLNESLLNHHESDRKSKKGKQVDHVELDEDNSHYFSLKNVTFCGNHPKDRRYFGFITKHPDAHRFACHVFMSKYTTDQMAKVIGQCFDKFYESYIEQRAPTEDIYLE